MLSLYTLSKYVFQEDHLPNLTRQCLLQQVICQHVATFHTDTTNSVLHCAIRIHRFPEKLYEQLEGSRTAYHHKNSIPILQFADVIVSIETV